MPSPEFNEIKVSAFQFAVKQVDSDYFDQD